MDGKTKVNAPRFRFSLRTLFIVTTLAAIACGWLVLPTLRAKRLAKAIDSNNFAAADRMLARSEDAFLEDSASADRVFAHIEDVGLLDLLTGQRKLSVLRVVLRQVGGQDVAEAQVVRSIRITALRATPYAR
jgi:hypothetical protein